MLLFLLLGLALWLWKDIFVLRSVTVMGGSVDGDVVIAAAGVECGTSVLSLNENAVREGIDALGAVCLEEYSLQLPDGLLLRIRDRKPAAMLPSAGGLLLIDSDCYAIGLVREAPDTDLLYVSGVELSQYQKGQAVQDEGGRMELCRSILLTLEAFNTAMYVSEIDLSAADAPRLITRGGICVELGAGALEGQLALMEAAVADLEGCGTSGGCLRIENDGWTIYSPEAEKADG